MGAVLTTWRDIRSDERAVARSRWLDQGSAQELGDCPLPAPVQAWEIHELLGEIASGTKPCTSCCTQCSSNCCMATC
ncbi:MAG: hypothetical protein LC799_21160 [Actinobacteria bacterium]|nr:hypothetical protein [Actinomycetota bacterium]